jgi:hypothetical protein
MGWHYSNGGGVGYAYSLLNTYNQHCAAIGGLTPGTAIIKLMVKAAGYSGAVATRLVAWGPGGSVVAQSSSFTMADGSISTQYVYERSVSSHVMQGDTVWVGVYRNPSGSHIMETTSGSGNGYRKTNTNSFPSVLSMSGYNTDSNDEPYVGVFMIAAPNDPTSASVLRNSDTSQTISWTRSASDDRPVYTQYLQRWDNVSNNWYNIKTITTDYTSNGNHSYTDTTTVKNRQYRYRMRSYNSAGYSAYDYTNYIHTTPSKPTNVVAARSGSNVKITWTDNSYQEDLFRIQSRESTDGGDTWGSWADVDTVGTGVTEYTDLSPYAYGQYRVQAEEGTYQSPTLLSGYTESGEVITLSQPNAPTGLVADIGIGDEDKIFSWNHNPTDNTAQTKFSLRIKVSGGTYPKEIESFDNYNEWTAVGSDIADLIEGPFPNQSVYMTDEDDSESYVGMYKNPSSIDLTQFDDASASTTDDLIVFTVYIFDKSYFTNLSVKLGDDNSNCFYTEVDPSVDLVNGWNQIAVAKSAFSTAGSPSGWDDITYVRIELYALDDSAYNSYIASKYLQLVKVTDFTNYAGDYFIQYHEVELTAEQLNIVANSLKNGNTYNWQVKTWGEYGTGSDWSNTATYFTVSRPIGIITNPTDVDNYVLSKLTMNWNYTQLEDEEQIQFLVNLYDSTGALLESHYESSSVANGESDSYTFDYTLENEKTYKVTLQVQSENEFWSEETETEFTTLFLQPTKPTFSLSLNEDNGSIGIDIVNPEVVTNYSEESTQDSYIDSDNSGVNYNDNGQLQLEDDTSSGTTVKQILLDFDLSFFVGKTIVSANLQLIRKTVLTPGIDSKVNYIKSSWDETTVTHGTIPTLDTTDYDDHTHSAGESEIWDLKLLLDDIADETITDFEGIAIVASTTDGSIDEFYDSTIEGSEPTLIIEIGPLNADADYNRVYRSVDGGSWELVQDEIPINTSITDYIPTVGGNNNYYIQAISDTPSSNNSDEVDLDVLLTGMFFVNGGNELSNVVRLVGDITFVESINRDEVAKQYKGRTYPIKYQGSSINNIFSFSADCPNSKKTELIYIIEFIGNIFYRDWRGNWFYAMFSNTRFDIKDPQAYQFNTNITRLNGGVE